MKLTLTRLALSLLLVPGAAWAQDCAPAPEPVGSLAFDSRYEEDSESRSEIDPEAAEEARDAVRPIDEFLRDLTEQANAIYEDGADRPAIAACVVEQIATWAKADALSDLGSETARLTIGSRIAGFGLVLLQVLPDAGDGEDVAEVKAWLGRLMQAQMLFWEEEAADGSKQGNLRAWAALGGATVARIIKDPVILGWSGWSVEYVVCKAEKDGSLPQEMKRGKLALQYQMHSLAPLVAATLILEKEGVKVQGICDGALSRAVAFAAEDLVNEGRASEAITGEPQSFFDGSDELEGFHVAWIEPYLKLNPDAYKGALKELADAFRPMSYSKLGGKQTELWDNL